jgi:hypothetical protein
VNDIEEIPVETVRGVSPSGAVGDRLLIGLAMLALLGGIAVATGNLFGSLFPEVAVRESPTAQASATPGEPTPRPTRTERPLSEVTVVPGEPPEPQQYEVSRPAWVEALVELPVRVTTRPDAAVTDVVAEGEVVLAAPEPGGEDGWFAIQAGADGGWIRVFGPDGTPRARIAPVGQDHLSGGVSAIVAGPAGFLVRGSEPGDSYASPDSMVRFSPDGEHWMATDQPVQPGWGGWAAAWGPSGWLTVVTMDDGSSANPWVWESSDGSHWTSVGMLPVRGDYVVRGLVGNERGYLLALGSSGGQQGAMWFSPDGITWQESGAVGFSQEIDEGFFGYGETMLLATEHGFLSWPRTYDLQSGAEVAFSQGGRSWEVTRLSHERISMLHVAVVGDTLLALGLNEVGETISWAGTVSDDGITMAAGPRLEPALDGAVVTSLVDDGQRAFAFGYLRREGLAAAWVSTGVGWRRSIVPAEGFGVVPRVVAAGPQGVVVAGARVGLVATSPVMWHMRTDGTWVDEATPTFSQIPNPTPDDCPPLPTTAFEFMAIGSGASIACFGNASISLVAWSGTCDGCWEESRPPRRNPDWLRFPSHFLVLLPHEGAIDSAWPRRGVLHPDLAWTRGWTDTWLRVTGHFDDPAARQCATGPEPGNEAWWHGTEMDVLFCRHDFVVTAVEVLGRDGG